MSKTALLKIEKLNHSFGEHLILNNIDFALNSGETIGIIGKSGAGKSTLLKLIAGFIDIQIGTVIFENKKIIGPKDKLIPGYEDMQLVQQDFSLDIYQTVQENIEQKILYLPNKEKAKMIADLLSLLDLEHIANLKAVNISGGEKQRLAIARALACEPKVLILDEPFSHLDKHVYSKITTYIKRLQEIRSLGLILVTHDERDIFTFCDKVLYLKKGRIVRVGSPLNFYFNPKSKEEALFFGEINEVLIDNKKLRFRPQQYSLLEEPNSKRIPVTFVESNFKNGIFENVFSISANKTIVLYNFKELNGTKEIFIF